MSTEMYLECLDHTPTLLSDVVGNREADLRNIWAVLAMRDVVSLAAGLDADYGDYCTNNIARFLAQHPTCRLGIRDEYGHEHPTTAPSPEPEPVPQPITADVQLWATDQEFLGIATASVARAGERIEITVSRQPELSRLAAAFDQIRMVATELDGERFVGIVSKATIVDTYCPAYVRLEATGIAQHFIDAIRWPGMAGYEHKQRLACTDDQPALGSGAC